MKKLNHTLFFVEGNPKFEDSDAAVLGVEFDESASYGKGAAFAPKAIMEASQQMDIEKPISGALLQTAIHNFGTIQSKNAKEMIEQTEEIANKTISQKKLFILLGGDHSVINGLLTALPKETEFVNFDAHLDLREEWQGKKMSHAAVSKRIFDKGFKQIWIGVRDKINEEEMQFISEQGLAGKVFYCATMPKEYYKGKEFPEWKKKENMIFGKGIESELAEKIVSEIEGEKVWLNIDIDCLDTGQGIETGTPMPFGLSLRNLNKILFRICTEKKVLGLSLAEVIPSTNKSSQVIAANIIYNVLCWLEESKASEF